jgi:hypothetical protein
LTAGLVTSLAPITKASSTFMWPGMRPATGWIAQRTLAPFLQDIGHLAQRVLRLRDMPSPGTTITEVAFFMMKAASSATARPQQSIAGPGPSRCQPAQDHIEDRAVHAPAHDVAEDRALRATNGPRANLFEKIAVRTEPDEPQQVGRGLGVDQQEVGPEMAVPIAQLISGQGMVAVP